MCMYIVKCTMYTGELVILVRVYLCAFMYIAWVVNLH